jgi:hypothetical protein
MTDGVYYSESNECYGLFIDGVLVMMSSVRLDCVTEASRLGYEFN